MRYIRPTKKTIGDRLAEISGGYNPGTAVRDVVQGLKNKEQERHMKENYKNFRANKGDKDAV